MDQRSTGIVATVVTALLCGCLGLTCIFNGGSILLSSILWADEIYEYGIYYLGAGIGMLCLGFVFMLIPVLVGIFTLRKKPQPVLPVIPPEEPLPPAL